MEYKLQRCNGFMTYDPRGYSAQDKGKRVNKDSKWGGDAGPEHQDFVLADLFGSTA